VGSLVLEEKRPILARHEQAARWLRMWADLGRAPRTIDAYGFGLAEYLEVCEREGVDLVEAKREHIARYVRELSTRPGRRGPNVVSIDSGAGLANATLQQRLVPVRGGPGSQRGLVPRQLPLDRERPGSVPRQPVRRRGRQQGGG